MDQQAQADPAPSSATPSPAGSARWRLLSLPPLPADDAPPAGLAPLVPSPRTMRVEAARGIRELEDWLAGQASA